MADNPYVNKVVLGNNTLLDLTGDTVTAADVAQGKTFHLASGAQAVGTASGGGVGSAVFYGTCTTANSTQEKAVVCADFTDDYYVPGTVLNVLFSNYQGYNGAPYLNVNNTGAVATYLRSTATNVQYTWLSGEVVTFVYDGQHWVMEDGGVATTTYYGVTKLSSATNSTSTALAATPSAVKQAYDAATAAKTVTDATADYIVETGNASGWRYVKWDSGWLEAWGYGSYTTGSSETWGSWVGYKDTPITMLNGDYYVFCQVQNWQWYRAYAGERTTTNFRVAVGSSGAATDTVFFYLTGYWK